MRALILLFSLIPAFVLSAETLALQTRQLPKERTVLEAKKSPSNALWLRLLMPGKKYQKLDKLAIIAICLDGVTVVATLFTYLVWGGVAAGFALAFSSVFTLAGMVLGAISLIRAAFRGWRRGTFWAILALGLPLIFLLLTLLIP